MTVVDTDVLVASLDRNHPHHLKAKAALAEGPLVITWGTLTEVASVTRRLAKDARMNGNQVARDGLAALLALAGFREAGAVPLENVVGLHRQEPALSFVDAWNLCAAAMKQDSLLTFDRRLQAAARRHRLDLAQDHKKDWRNA